LVVMNCFNFCLLWKDFSSIMKDSLGI
jgi:hypothetical protein